MTRKLLLIAPLLLLHSAVAQALGLDDIDLKSALNQPFDAEIRLHSAGAEDLNAISVGLASNLAFDKAGVDRHPALNQLVFTVKTRRDGTSYIKVSSQQPIREPFLDFIIEVNWPAGQLLREYTVLLDPPALTQERPAAVAPALTSPAMPQPAPKAEPQARPAISAAAPAASKEPAPAAPRAAGANEFGPTGRTDTLWSIAEQMRPDSSVSIPQTMIALLKSNPEAFYNDNINDLKAGYVLRLDQSQLNAIGKSEAERESRRQYQEWQARKRGESITPVRPQGAVPDAARGAPAAAAAQGPRLKLVAPTAEELRAMEAAGTVSSGEGAIANVDKLRKDLALAMETADRTTLENDELKQRITTLEAQIAEMQRLVTLKDDTLGAMQAQQADKAPESPAAETPAPATAPVAEESRPNEEPNLFASPVVLSTAVALLLGIAMLGWKMYRRRQLDSLESSVFTSTAIAATAAAAASARNDADAMNQAPSATPSAAVDTHGSFVGRDEGISAEIDDIDVLSEADVYLAYHRYPQAEALIKGAIEHHPERLDLQLKLLETYFAAQDRDHFIVQAEQLHDAVGGVAGEDSDTWQRAAALGQEMVPEHPLFGGADAHATPVKKVTAAIDDDASATALLQDKAGAAEMTDIPLADDGDMNLMAVDEDAAVTGEPDDDSSAGEGFELDSSDVVATKLDLAKAYVDMGDHDGARSILDEVVAEGSDAQKREAQELLAQIG